MLNVRAYAAPSATEPLAPTTIQRRDLRPNDVLIDIAYAGICHSDIHTVRGDWVRSPTHRSSVTRSSVGPRGRCRGDQARGGRPSRRRLRVGLVR